MKMVFDCEWPTTTKFSEAIGPIAKYENMPPMVMIRTNKSNVMVGLQEGQDQILTKEDPEWMVNGKFGNCFFF